MAFILFCPLKINDVGDPLMGFFKFSTKKFQLFLQIPIDLFCFEAFL